MIDIQRTPRVNKFEIVLEFRYVKFSLLGGFTLTGAAGSEQRKLAYSSEENAIVEQTNIEVLRHLRAIIHDTKVITEVVSLQEY